MNKLSYTVFFGYSSRQTALTKNPKIAAREKSVTVSKENTFPFHVVVLLEVHEPHAGTCSDQPGKAT